VQRRQFHPLANVWIRAAVPLQYYRQPNRAGFDLASVGRVPRSSFWISTRGAYGPLNSVEAIGVTMQAPLGRPVYQLEQYLGACEGVAQAFPGLVKKRSAPAVTQDLRGTNCAVKRRARLVGHMGHEQAL
jgi:hypothetical protein